MRINKLQVEQNNKIQNKEKVKSQTFGLNPRSFVRTLANPDAFTSTVLLETAVTGGRSYNAYKRGGMDELRERFIDDILSAIFWMKGVDIFNGIGDKIGKHILKLPITEFDVGKDALRTPFANVIEDLPSKLEKNVDVDKMAKKLSAFKFTKIVASTLLATGFVGFLLPKMNQALTRKLVGKNKKVDQNNSDLLTNNSNKNNVYMSPFSTSMEEFDKKISQVKTTPSFGSLITTAAHALENNKVCKLLSSDVGIATGRFKSARNVDEGIEYLVRDSLSSFFYVASTPLIYMGLQKISDSSKYTSIDPVAAKTIHSQLVENLKNAGGQISVDEFGEKIIGSIDEETKSLIDNLPFDKNVISLKKLKEYLTDESLLEKAMGLAKLQPEQAGVGAVLTKQQVEDIFKQGTLTQVEFMKHIFTEKFGDDLTNRAKFIPMQNITRFRQGIDDYVNSVVKYAKSKNMDTITEELLEKFNKKSFVMSAGFRGIAIGISALFLGMIIPKIQYAITKIRTGSSAAPGLREYQEAKKA